MSERKAQIGTGGGTVPGAAARRRRMGVEVRRARQILTGPEGSPAEQAAALRLFALINHEAAPMLGLVALGTAGVALGFVDAPELATWAVLVVCAVGLVYALPIAFLDSGDPGRSAGAWARKFILATAFCGSAWAYLIVALLRSRNPDAPAFAMLVMLLVSTVMSLLAATIPAAFVAGMLPMMIGVGLAYASRLENAALPVAAVTIGVVGYVLVVVHRLRASATRNVSLQAEKDSLIAELEQAKLNSDEARRRAESANLAKSRFLATMSHELRTPLNAILGFSEVMKGELFGPHGVAAYKEYSSDIHVSGQHLLMLINEILDLSRVEAGRYELNEEPVSLPGVVEDCCRLLSMRATSRNLTLTESLDKTLPRIWADERAVRQIAINLLTNAIKFTPQGGSVAIKVGWTASGGQYVVDQGHRARHSAGGDSRGAVVLRPRLAGAQERRGRDGIGAADRQGARRTARRTVPPDLDGAAGHRGRGHLPAGARHERAGRARSRRAAGIRRERAAGVAREAIRPRPHEGLGSRPFAPRDDAFFQVGAFSPKPAASSARWTRFWKLASLPSRSSGSGVRHRAAHGVHPRPLRLGEVGEHEIVHERLVARMADAEPDPPVVVADMGGDRAQAVVPGDAAADLDPHLGGREVELVVEDGEGAQRPACGSAGLRRRSGRTRSCTSAGRAAGRARGRSSPSAASPEKRARNGPKRCAAAIASSAMKPKLCRLRA